MDDLDFEPSLDEIDLTDDEYQLLAEEDLGPLDPDEWLDWILNQQPEEEVA